MTRESSEVARLASLRSYAILDTEPEPAFDGLARLAADLCDAPIALVSLVDETRQWFKSRVGLTASETPRVESFCSHAIESPDQIFEVTDAATDSRFLAHPLVEGDPGIRFYAGACLRDGEGRPLGTLCVIDTVARSLTTQQRRTLAELAHQVEALLELRRRSLAIDDADAELPGSPAVISTDADFSVTGWNAGAEQLYGRASRDVLGRRVSEILGSEMNDHDVAAAARRLFDVGSWEGEVNHADADGVPMRIWSQIKVVSDAAGGGRQVVATNRDITARVRQRILREVHGDVLASLARGDELEGTLGRVCRAIEEAIPGAMASAMLVDGGVLRLGAAPSLPVDYVEAIAGIPIGPETGSCGTAAHTGVPVLSSDIEHDPRWAQYKDVALAAGVRSCWSIPVGTAQGRPVAVLATYFTVARAPSLAEQAFVKNLADLTSVVLGRMHLVGRDELTGLFGRVALERALDALVAPSPRMGLLAIRLDRLARVNEALSLAAGDEALSATAARIQDAVGHDRLLVRFAGDEFVVLAENIEGEIGLVGLASEVVAAMSEPLSLSLGHEVLVTASVGAVIVGEAEPHAALRSALTAAREARERGGNQYRMGARVLAGGPDEAVRDAGALHRAISGGELELHYQPRYDLRTGYVNGVEALVRWRRDGQLIPPLRFIPLAEETGLIIQLGAWALREACRQAKTWADDGILIEVAVNVSPRQIADPTFPALVAEVLATSGIEAKSLILEVTESTLVGDEDELIAVIGALGALGAQVSVDDFGTGTSALGHLRKFPVHELKIDRSFVAEMDEDATASGIVTAVVNLGQALGLRTVAEGLERLGQLRMLQALRCHSAQGFLLARPLPASEVTPLLRLPHEHFAQARNTAADHRAPVLDALPSSVHLAAFQQAPLASSLSDGSGRRIAVNDALCHLTGRTESELLAGHFWDALHPEDVQLDRAAMDRLRTGVSVTGTWAVRYVRPDGEIRRTQVHAAIASAPRSTDQPGEESARWIVRQILDLTDS